MPLEESGSDEAFDRNVSEMIRAGHPREQALAAAYAMKRKHGGKDETAAKAFPRVLILKANGAPRPPADPPEPVQPDHTPELPPPPRAEPDEPPPIAVLTSSMKGDAERFAKAAEPMRFIDPERPWVSHLVGRDLANPETWRHTTLVDNRPFEDAEFPVAVDAFASALRAGGVPAQVVANA